MKTRALLGLAVLVLSLGTATGAAAQRRATVGAQVGYSRADLVGRDAEQIQSRQGALSGVFLQAPLGRFLALRPELLFSLRGGRTEVGVEGAGPAVLDIELAYLELPVLLRFAPPGRVRPVLFAGPAPALQIGCDFSFVFPTDSARVTCGRDQLTVVREWDVGLVAGGGIEWRFVQAALAIEARYTAGMRSILDDVQIRNRGMGLLLALTF